MSGPSDTLGSPWIPHKCALATTGRNLAKVGSIGECFQSHALVLVLYALWAPALWAGPIRRARYGRPEGILTNFKEVIELIILSNPKLNNFRLTVET
jgi:hypothetical protein